MKVLVENPFQATEGKYDPFRNCFSVVMQDTFTDDGHVNADEFVALFICVEE